MRMVCSSITGSSASAPRPTPHLERICTAPHTSQASKSGSLSLFGLAKLALFCAKVDGFVPQTQDVDLRIGSYRCEAALHLRSMGCRNIFKWRSLHVRGRRRGLAPDWRKDRWTTFNRFH